MNYSDLKDINILITAGYLGEFGETDGVVTTYSNLLSFFIKSGIKADIIAYGPYDQIRKYGNVRIIIHKPKIPVRIDPHRLIDLSFLWQNPLQDILRSSYALVQSSTPDPLGLMAYRISRQNQCPFISVYHTVLDQYVLIRVKQKLGTSLGEVSGWIMHRWLGWYNRKANLVLVPSQEAKHQVAKLTGNRIELLSRGVDSDRFSPRNRKRTDQKPRALYVGRIAIEKGLDLLIDIFSDRDDLELMIVGDGPYLNEMQKALPRAVFTSLLSGDDLCRAYADADFFVFPSKTDTLGNVVLEAMSSGLPVIVTDRMGPKELIRDGFDGFIARTEKDFADQVNYLARNRDVCRSMGKLAREAVKDRSWKSVFDDLSGYYRMILENNKPPVVSFPMRLNG